MKATVPRSHKIKNPQNKANAKAAYPNFLRPLVLHAEIDRTANSAEITEPTPYIDISITSLTCIS